MGKELVPRETGSWVSRPDRSPERITRAERQQLRQAEVDRRIAKDGVRNNIEMDGMRAQGLDALTSFANTSLTDRKLQANEEAETSGLADDLEYNMNVALLQRALRMGYGRIARRISGE